jgi:protein-S-isoprenylcysteine O-methyltransferase Ste14
MYFILGGLAIYEFGIALAVWSKLTLQDNWGSPGEHNTQYQKELVTNGPFAYSRNPLYIGLLLITFGFGITVQSFLALLFIPLYFYFLTIIRKEETLLEQHFGKEYKEYRKKVSRFL